MNESRKEIVKKKRPRVQLHETTSENDIRYRGPFSYLHFQILGWSCIAIAQVALLLQVAGNIDQKVAADTATLFDILNVIAPFSLPFLLIAVFAQLLNTENGYMSAIVKNGVAMVGIFVMYVIAFYRYLAGGIGAFLTDPGQVVPTIQRFVSLSVPGGFMTFNIFVDLFLCALVMLFLNYNPRRVFTGKAVVLFRLLALLPIAYEAGCMVLKARAARGLIEIPIWAYALLPVKPAMTFVLFIALALFIKTRELRFRRHGKTHEEYRAFLKTRRNSLNFSVFLAIMLVVVSLVDFAVVIGFSLNEVIVDMDTRFEEAKVQASATEAPPEALTDKGEDPLAFLGTGLTDTFDFAALRAALNDTLAIPEPAEAEPTEAPRALTMEEMREAAIKEAMDEAVLVTTMTRGMSVADAVGFGGSVGLFLLAPLVLLFSYTRRPKRPWMSLIVPLVGVILIFLIYLEGTHRILYILPIQKIDLEELREMIMFYVGIMF